MALQGSLDTIALPDILRLLASTKKTGCLRLTTARGTGAVWVDGGAIVSASAERAPRSAATAATLFELLRSLDGDFEFEPRAIAAQRSEPEDVEVVLADAEARLAEWREIEAVVPSLAARVTLRLALPESTVTLDQARWRLVVAVGGGATVGDVGTALGLDEIPVSREVKELVESGLADVTMQPPSDEMVEITGHDEVVTMVDEDQDLSDQLAMLSPRAAHAVAAAAFDTTTA